MVEKTASGVKRMFSFFQLCGKLKHLKRSGWVNSGVVEPETVAGHMYRMAMMSLLFGTTSKDDSTYQVDRERCIRMALVHDLAESLVGDITPHDGVTKDEKHALELKGIEQIKTLIPDQVGSEVFELWKEYEEGTSPEAILVKDLDKFDMIFQAFEYETSQQKKLQEFFDSTQGKFQHPVVKYWVEQLQQERKQREQTLAQDKV